MTNIQAIKAELYDLQWHECEGQFTVRADGHFDSDDKSCEACSRILLLQKRLRDDDAQLLKVRRSCRYRHYPGHSCM